MLSNEEMEKIPDGTFAQIRTNYIMEQYNRGCRMVDIADAIGTSASYVFKVLKSQGYPSKKHVRLIYDFSKDDTPLYGKANTVTVKMFEFMKKAYLAGYKVEDIASPLYLTPITVLRYMRRAGIKRNFPEPYDFLNYIQRHYST